MSSRTYGLKSVSPCPHCMGKSLIPIYFEREPMKLYGFKADLLVVIPVKVLINVPHTIANDLQPHYTSVVV